LKKVNLFQASSSNQQSTINYQQYIKASKLLDYYIELGKTTEFFENFRKEYIILMPELVVTGRYPILKDLKAGYTSVSKHPQTLKSGEEVYIYQIFVVETGEPPVY